MPNLESRSPVDAPIVTDNEVVGANKDAISSDLPSAL